MGDPNCELISVATQPPSDSLPEKRAILLPENPVDLQTKIYKSDEACAAFLFPFKNYLFDPLVVKVSIFKITISFKINHYLKNSHKQRNSLKISEN